MQSFKVVSVLALPCLAACDAYHEVAPSPVFPLQAAVSAAVVVEDMYEDPECHAKPISFLENLSDVLATLWLMAWDVVAIQVAMWWSLYDAVTLSPAEMNPDARFREVIAWLPVHYAGIAPWEEQYRQPEATCQ